MTNAIPVKYMVISAMFGMKYLIIDTSVEGQGREVGRASKLIDAHTIAYALNRVEGFEYPHSTVNVIEQPVDFNRMLKESGFVKFERVRSAGYDIETEVGAVCFLPDDIIQVLQTRD